MALVPIKKIFWLIDVIKQSGEYGISRKKIVEKYISRFDESEYPRRTFEYHKTRALDELGVQINCNRSTNRYFINNNNMMDDISAAAAWFMDIFTIQESVELTKNLLSGRINVERPYRGGDYLLEIINNMREGNVITITYQRFKTKASANETKLQDSQSVDNLSQNLQQQQKEEVVLEPYAVFMSKNLLYVYGRRRYKKDYRTYALDRFVKLTTTLGSDGKPMNFKMPGTFDIKYMLGISYGVYFPEIDWKTGEATTNPESIVFRANDSEACYLRNSPIHSTQEEMTEKEVKSFLGPDAKKLISHHNSSDNKYIYFRIICHSHSIDKEGKPHYFKQIIMDFASRGANVEIISPRPLREQLAKFLYDAAHQYQDSEQ